MNHFTDVNEPGSWVYYGSSDEQKISCIKILREYTGFSLWDAKHWIESGPHRIDQSFITTPRDCVAPAALKRGMTTERRLWCLVRDLRARGCRIEAEEGCAL